MTRYSAAFAVVVVTAVAVLTGCGSGDEDGSEGGGQAAEERPTVGFVLPGLEGEGLKAIADGAEAAADKAGIDLRVDGSNAAEEQVSAGQNYVGAGVDLIGVDPVDGTAVSQVAEAANAADIPVVTVIAGLTSGEVATHVGPSYKEGGALIGQAMVDFCQDKDPCRVAIIQGNPSDLAGAEEYEAFKAEISKAANIEVVADQPADWDDQTALNVATNVLTANEEVDAFFVMWEAGGLAALEAIRAAGREDDGIGLFSFGGVVCPYVEEMLAGNATQTVFVSWPEIGRIFVETAAKVLDGAQVPKAVDVPLYSVTADQAKRVVAGEEDIDPSIAEQIKNAADGC